MQVLVFLMHLCTQYKAFELLFFDEPGVAVDR